MYKFDVYDAVAKMSGDYIFEGHVVARFQKKSGALRYVVEDGRGLLFIFNEAALEAAVSVIPEWVFDTVSDHSSRT